MTGCPALAWSVRGAHASLSVAGGPSLLEPIWGHVYVVLYGWRGWGLGVWVTWRRVGIWSRYECFAPRWVCAPTSSAICYDVVFLLKYVCVIVCGSNPKME